MAEKMVQTELDFTVKKGEAEVSVVNIEIQQNVCSKTTDSATTSSMDKIKSK
jgi:hypothetical protein